MTDKVIQPSTGKALQAVLTGDREAIRRKVRAHQPSPEAQAFMEAQSAGAPNSAPAKGATPAKGKP